VKGKFTLPALVSSAAVARAIMAGIPNLEPITAFAMLAGLRYGPIQGFLTGSLALLLSDLYIGLPGPWTFFTFSAFGLVGFISGFLPKSYIKDRKKLATSAAFLTLLYQVIVNSAWPLITGQSLLLATIMAIPFAAIQIIGNTVIVPLCLPHAALFIDVVKDKVEEISKAVYLT